MSLVLTFHFVAQSNIAQCLAFNYGPEIPGFGSCVCEVHKFGSLIHIKKTLCEKLSCEFAILNGVLMRKAHKWFKHCASLVRTGGVRSGPDRKCDRFPWFVPVPGSSCLLPINYNFSMQHHSKDCSSIYFQNGSETTSHVRRAINKLKFHHSESCKLLLQQNFAAMKYTD